jgi:hypothetical protein
MALNPREWGYSVYENPNQETPLMREAAAGSGGTEA